MGHMSEAEALLRQAAGYLKPDDVSQLESAFHFSAQAHEGQFRKTGEPYVSHPVAEIGRASCRERVCLAV